MIAADRPDRRRDLLRVLGALVSVGLIVMWILFFRDIFAGSQGRPAPSGFMLPLFFCSLALAGGLAALRGEGISVVVAGGLSLVPMGIFLVVFPGPQRLIGVLDVALIAIGLALVRGENRRLFGGAGEADA